MKWLLGLKLSLAALLGFGHFEAAALDFPTKPIRILLPYEPGGAVDLTTRLAAEAVSKELGQPIVVESKPGGYGMVAMDALKSAKPDGYTLMADTPAAAINPSVFKVRYDPLSDLEPVAQLVAIPFAVAINPAIPAKTFQEFVALAKAKPDTINFTSAGTSTRLATELLMLQAGIKLVPVNYKGAAPSITAVLGNESQLILIDVANLATHIQGGAMRGLLVTGDARSDVIPDVPTAKEVGFPNFDPVTWFGVFAPKGVPAEVVERLNGAFRTALKDPELVETLRARGAVPSQRTAKEFSDYFRSEVARWADVVKQSGVKFE
jgi:tripartite-type tricarboxylate transporter receptor subunit TctC